VLVGENREYAVLVLSVVERESVVRNV